MDIVQLIILIILAAGLVYYFLVAASVKNSKSRINDLLVVGLLILVSAYLERQLPIWSSVNSTQIAGFLIFAYAWILVIIEKFREGLKDE